jgi:hypothetical protein
MSRPGGQIDEQVAFSKRVKPADISDASIIVDYKDRKIVKSVIEGKVLDTDFNRLHEYYNKIYPTLIQQLTDHNMVEGKTKKL